jgi:hypothetical protein
VLVRGLVAEGWPFAFMAWDVATTYESRRKVLFNEFKDLAAYFHSRLTKAEGFVMNGNRLFCDSCGKENPTQARFCGYCGKAREDNVPEWVHEEKRKRKFRKTYGRFIWSVVSITLALCVYLWARSHSPYMGFGEMMTTAFRDPNYFILNERVYTVIMVVVAGLALAAVLEIILALAAFGEE